MDDHRIAAATTGTRPVAVSRSTSADKRGGEPAVRHGAGHPGEPVSSARGGSADQRGADGPGGYRPRRVLVVSADMGGGHHATADALEESVGRVWPGSETKRIDALDVMGGWVGDAFRGVYVSNVQSTPWLYEFFYSSLWRHRWFAHASKRFVGSWCGRRLVKHIDAFDPDLVLSTYPLGTAGLAWLIRRRALSVPVACWVSDFAPHPFWVYREVAVNYLVDPAAEPAARCAEPAGRYRISALPVSQRFQPDDRAAIRERLGLRPNAMIALIGCGSYAFGDVVSLVRTVADVSDQIQVVAACGRNDQIRARITELGFSTDRVTPLGWTDEMPAVTAAADLVIGNAGGATALEAMACGVPVVLTEPIAAHGAANADLMAVAGAAELCTDEPALTGYLRTMISSRDTHRTTNGAPRTVNGTPPPINGAPTNVDGTPPPDTDRADALDRDVAAVAGLSNNERVRRYSRWPMRSADAFFCHVETTGASQELGVVLQLGTCADGSLPTLESIRASLQTRTSMPSLRRVLVRKPPGWRLLSHTDTADHVDELVLRDGDRAAAWDAAGDYFAQRMPPDRAAWQMRLIRGWSDTEALFAIKLHHSQGDGISALGLLDRLLDPADGDPLPERRPLGHDTGVPVRQRLSTLGRGLIALAGRGFAPRHALGARSLSAQRQLVAGSVPWSAVRALAKQTGASLTETSIAVGAHVLARVLGPTGLLADGAPLRAMVPVAMRPARLDREFGNWTGSVAADLEMAAMPLQDRVRQVRDELRQRHRDGEAPAAAAVMALAGGLPTPVHRAFTRAVYHRRFFSTVVSFMPGARRARWLAGAPVTAMIPVLPLPPRVPITLGMIVTAGRLDFGITVDGQLNQSRDRLQRAVAEALAEVR